MGLVDDLNRLSDLHAAGQLSDEEFEEAKTRMIRESTGVYPSGGDTAGGLATSTGYDPTLTPPTFDPGVPAGPTEAPDATAGTGTAGAAAPPPPGAAAPPAPGSLPGGHMVPTTTVRSGAPATVITTGLGTGAVSLGSLPPTTRIRTRVQGLSVPGAVEPKRSSTGTFIASLGCLTVVVLFVALMVATAGVAMFPGLARLTAPIFCDAPFDHSYVDITSTPGDDPGETYINWDLQCYNDRGTVEQVDDWKVMGVLFIGTTAALFVIAFLFAVIGRLRHRKRAKADPPLQPGAPSGNLADLSGGPIINA